MQKAVDEFQERFAPERLLGLMAQLALPEVRGGDGVFRKPRIEIEVVAGQWELIDSLSINDSKMVFSFGINGKRQEWTFLHTEGCPAWRRVRSAVVHGLGAGCA